MFNITSIQNTNKQNTILNKLGFFLLKFSNLFEVFIIVLFWIIIFKNSNSSGEFTRENVIIYILIGNFISLITGFFSFNIVNKEIQNKNSKMLIYNPIKYFFHVIFSNFTKFIPIFIFSALIYSLFLHYFSNNFLINKDPMLLLIIAIMIILAFFTEFLIIYLINIYIFWTFESKHFFQIIIRLKKIISGNYFPIDMLSIIFVKISYYLPFAYSFFVPTQLYLKKISIQNGIKGIIIQIFWIIFLYIIISISWHKQIQKNKI